jgi:hypothetical protein
MKIFLSALLGGLAVFVWSFLSWMVLPWHDAHIFAFKDEAAVVEVLKANAPAPGLYMMPDAGSGGDWKAGAERMRTGPFFFGVVRPGSGDWSFTRLMIGSLLTQIAGALIITILVKSAGFGNYLGRVIFSGAIGLAAGVLGHLPNLNWWEFPRGWTLINITDLVIGWCIGGLVIAAFTRPRPQRDW